MNKKQLSCMWVGIIAFTVLGFIFVDDFKYGGPIKKILPFVIHTLIITVVTGGLIATFKDKKKEDGESEVVGKDE